LFWHRPDFLTPIHITKTSMIERDELPTALAERNMPSVNMNYFSTDGPTITNYGQDDAIKPSVVGGVNNENDYASYGMFISRSLRYGKLLLINILIVLNIIEIIMDTHY